ncbi:MAG: hypothetical protein AAFX80_01690 [Cyanobacteria bacterium J06639_18]
MDELIPQQEIEQYSEEFNISEIEFKQFDRLNDRLKSLYIKFEANKIQRVKVYGRKRK